MWAWLRFLCSKREEAEDLASRIRQRCSWWGRDTPQHIVVLYNPASGKSRQVDIINDGIYDAAVRYSIRTAASLNCE